MCLFSINLMFHNLPAPGYPSGASSSLSLPLCYNESVVLTSSNWFRVEPVLFCTAWRWRSQEQRGHWTHTHTHILVLLLSWGLPMTRNQRFVHPSSVLRAQFLFFTCCSNRWWRASNRTSSVCSPFSCVPWSSGQGAAVWPSMCDAVGTNGLCLSNKGADTHSYIHSSTRLFTLQHSWMEQIIFFSKAKQTEECRKQHRNPRGPTWGPKKAQWHIQQTQKQNHHNVGVPSLNSSFQKPLRHSHFYYTLLPSIVCIYLHKWLTLGVNYVWPSNALSSK